MHCYNFLYKSIFVRWHLLVEHKFDYKSTLQIYSEVLFVVLDVLLVLLCFSYCWLFTVLYCYTFFSSTIPVV